VSTTQEYADLAALTRQGRATGTWILDPSASQVEFRARTFWGLVTVTGRFAIVGGEAEVAPDGRITAAVTIDAASVDTASKKRDEHLRSAHFFDADRYPHLQIVVDDIALTGKDTATAGGRMTVAEHTWPISFEASVALPTPDRAEIDAGVDVDRREFGLTRNPLGMIRPTVRGRAHLVFRHTVS
jgi:polyisoprenoid-binding protein YceI